MPYNPAIHNRHSIRLPGYDYSQAGAYYVTINTHKKEHLFGEVVGGVVKLSPLGKIVQEEWLKIPTNFSNVVLDAFVIMANHVHGIVVIIEGGVHTGSTTSQSHAQSESLTTPTRLGSQPGSLPAIVQKIEAAAGKDPLVRLEHLRVHCLKNSCGPKNSQSDRPPARDLTLPGE